MSMFESIKGALASSSEGKSKFSEIMQTKPGNTYTVRLLPDGKSPVDTFFHYYNMGWNSFATGQYVQALSPQTFGERCPINEERFRLSRTGTDEEKEKASALRRTEKWLVNVYVVDDPTNPENNIGERTIYNSISSKELLKILNLHIYVYNNKTTWFENEFRTNPHLFTNQNLIFEIQKNIDCEIVDIEKKNNLLSYLNFNFSDEKNEEIKRKYSQKAPKEFYSMFLEYILNRDVKTIKEHFEKIYNKFDVIDIKSVYSIKENFEIINLINKEIEIYNKIGE